MKYFQNQQVTGSFTILGDLDIQGAITALTQSVASASISETSSYALTASYALNAGGGGGDSAGTNQPIYLHVQNTSAVSINSSNGNSKGMKWDYWAPFTHTSNYISSSSPASHAHFGTNVAAGLNYFQPQNSSSYEVDVTVAFQPMILPSGSYVILTVGRQYGFLEDGSFGPNMGEKTIMKYLYGTDNSRTIKSVNIKAIFNCTPYDRIYATMNRSTGAPDPVLVVTGSEGYNSNFIIKELPSLI